MDLFNNPVGYRTTPIYLSPSEELAAEALDEFAGVWDKKYPMISKPKRSLFCGI
jgi:transposase-like protein